MKVEYLGDVHLGKKFEAGVPLHRRGDREHMQLAQFRKSLIETNADLHIQVGDLFDKMYVPYTVIWQAAQAYIEAKRTNPQVIYALLRGNHDASRDLDKVSAFQIFTALVRPHGIVVADDEVVVIGDHVLVPWHPVKTAVEMIEGLTFDKQEVVVGHWDIVMGEDNQLPSKELKLAGAGRVVTGHDHHRREITMDGLDVFITGSMQPYSHAEDPEGNLYITKTLAEVLAAPDSFTDKCLRIALGPDEVLDQSIDCYQLTLQRQKSEDVVDLGDVSFEAFDMNILFDKARAEVGLEPEFGTMVLERLEAERAARS